MGRSTIFTDQVHHRLLEAFRTGHPVSTAADYAGVSTFALRQWLSRGERYDEHLTSGGEPITGEHHYWLLWQDVREARSSAALSASRSMRTAWENGDWRAGLAYLERVHPEHWEKSQKVEMTGADGGPIRVADVTETERRLAESLRQALATPTETIDVVEVVEDIEIVSVEANEGSTAAEWVAEDDDTDPYAPWSASLGLD